MEIVFYVVSIAAAGWLAVALAKRLSPPSTPVIAKVPASTQTTPKVAVSATSILAPHVASLEQTRRPVLAIELVPMTGDDVLTSKVGGRAYWPQGHDYPRDSEGQPLFLLAQIDFSAAPSLPGHPDSGLLQFFISSNDHYGADFDAGPARSGGQKDYRVVYWPAPLPAPEAAAMPPVDADVSLPMDPRKPRKMRFTAHSETMGASDVGIEAVLGQAAYALAEDYAERNGVPEDDVVDALYTHLERTGHKLGGYPHFTQEDPRAADDPRVLLMQLDTDDEMMWGDAGVANFFIHPDDLARRDFSRVIYNWDCH